MTRTGSLLGTAAFLLAAPGVVAGVVPYWITHWRTASEFGAPYLAWLGWALIAFGAAVLAESFLRFALVGAGTPAPIAPTEHLVVSGFYAHVRNPMYVAVTALNLSQAALFASTYMLAYAALIWVAFHTFVWFYEEPTLRARYGEAYDSYVARVPRWLPRLTPWRG